MTGTEAGTAAPRRFRFRFLVRGEQSTSLLRLAVLSLARCNPAVSVVVVYANDQPAIDPGLFGSELDHAVVHVPPGEDAVAKAVGRGSRRHLFHWRHSPEVRAALPAFDGFDVHADADLLFLRPLDLIALVEPLAAGRIAAVVDESTLDHFAAVSADAGGPSTAAMPTAEPGGQMWQTGLIFSDPTDDGGLYDHVWQAALDTAASGRLAELPNDDMAIFAALLGFGGPLWHRALALGHDWNYVSDELKDPGVFGRVAHYGGRRAKDHLLMSAARMFPLHDAGRAVPWGSLFRQADAGNGRAVRGLFGSLPLDGRRPVTPLLPLPLCLTWLVPHGVERMHLDATTVVATRPDERPEDSHVTFHVHHDGRMVRRVVQHGDPSLTVLPAGATTVTLIAVADRPGLALRTHGLVFTGDPR